VSDAKIETRENGPLIAKNLTRVVAADGSEIEVKEVMALCCCGASKNKPFCDGSHNEVGFDSAPGTPDGRDRLITYSGAEISVTYNPMLCSHAAECVRLAEKVFDPEQKPWIQPDNGSAEDVRAVIAACPSGALALALEDGVGHLFNERAEVSIEKNGPYWVQNIGAPDGTKDNRGVGASAEKYVLCRCGKSGNKPYCDGTHRDAGWRDDT